MKTLLAATTIALTLTAGAVTARAQGPVPPWRVVGPPPVPGLVLDIPIVVPFFHRHHGPVVVVPEPYCPPPPYYYGRPYPYYPRHYYGR